jgi:excisionase family DNA binding protein
MCRFNQIHDRRSLPQERGSASERGDLTGTIVKSGVPVPNPDHGPVTLDDLKGRHFAEVWEVARILEADPRTIRTACRAGEIPYTKVGSEYRIPVSWLRQQAEVAAS